MLVAGMRSNAITALQFGVDARIIALRGAASPSAFHAPLVLVNPEIVSRSPEERMVPWREICLVLPPELEIDLLRDEAVRVAARDVTGRPFAMTLRGEAARALQHEVCLPCTRWLAPGLTSIDSNRGRAAHARAQLDHLNGVLIIDHVPAPGSNW